ncbi:hypothetical protein EPN44_06885 [bacterium]|nr:MAG: hypothetical protein EPN44_06885 [bacterium]
MSCSMHLQQRTARERVDYLRENLAPGLFKGVGVEEGIAWRLSPEPFALSPATFARIERLGHDLLAFYRAVNKLYLQSAKGTAPAFVAEYLDRGKPEHIIKLARQNRWKHAVPGVIRPDLILTDDGFVASELDSVPGGMGFVGAMSQTYCELGDDVVGGGDGMLEHFAAMIAGASGLERPTAAIVVSDESADYRAEMDWFTQSLRDGGYLDAYAVHPRELAFTEEAIFLRLPEGREERVDVIYRFFELFDLLNVPKHELMLYAARHGRVTMTPPPKAHLEEKLLFALLHHARLAPFWKGELGEPAFSNLSRLFPQTWVLDPRPLPAQATIAGLTADGKAVFAWDDLLPLSKSDRDFVIKPSGFDATAWGSRGVVVANDLTKDTWAKAIHDGLDAFDRTPHILQRFHKGRRVQMQFLDPAAGELRTMDGRVRLCPYYFVEGDEARLGGILATAVPADKRLIHGMSDAIMAPCAVHDSGA